MKNTQINYLLLPCVFAIALTISACTPKYSTVTPELRTQLLSDFKAGRTNLSCQLSCDWSWLRNFNPMVLLHNTNQWESLALLVMQTGLEKDIAYYFLGRAADGLGYNQAAIGYYKRSSNLSGDATSLHHCRSLQNGCGGIDMASGIQARLAASQTIGMAPTGIGQTNVDETVVQDNNNPENYPQNTQENNNKSNQEQLQKQLIEAMLTPPYSQRGEAKWTVETIKGMPFLKGNQMTLYGNAYANIFCDRSNLKFVSIYEVGDVASTIATGNYLHSLKLDGSEIPLPKPLDSDSTDNGYVSVAFNLGPKLVSKIYSARSGIGHNMKLAEDSPTGHWYIIDITPEGTKLIKSFIDECRKQQALFAKSKRKGK